MNESYFLLLHCAAVPDEEICEVTARCTRPLDASRQTRVYPLIVQSQRSSSLGRRQMRA